MTPRQARCERRAAERKAKKLELKKNRLAAPPAFTPADYLQIQPRWNPALEDEFPKEVQIRHNFMSDLAALKAGLPLPPPGPSPTTAEEYRDRLLAARKAKDARPVAVTELDRPTPL